MSDKFTHVYIVTDQQFPVGFAPTNRIISYAKGFRSFNYETMVLIFRKTEPYSNPVNYETSGDFEGFTFKYFSNSTIKSKAFLKRRYDVISMALCLFLYSISNFDRNSIIIYYSSHTFPAFLLWISSIIKHFKILKEEGEHPSVRTNLKSKFSSFIFINFHYLLFDGLLVISKSLEEYFRRRYPIKPITHVPMMVDMERFNFTVKKEKILTYCGSINSQKDGVDILIKAYGRIVSDFQELKLKLIGDILPNDDFLEIQKIVDELGIQSKIIFTGRISNEKIPFEISKSSVLILPRPNSIQAEHGFPTKLGEYLATGNPVIVTSVGEIPHYLKEDENAYIAIPGVVESLELQIRKVLGNPKGAEVVGEKGRETADAFFNNKTIVRNVISFIEKEILK